MITVINIIFGITLIPWLLALVFSVFLFDDPNNVLGGTLIFLLILSYGVVVILSIYLSRSRHSVLLSFLPLIILTILFLVYLPGQIKINKAIKDAYDNSPRDFTCPDGSFISLGQKGQQGIYSNVSYFAKGGYEPEKLGFITPKDISTIILYDAYNSKKEFLQKKDFYTSCINKDGKNIFDIYKFE